MATWLCLKIRCHMNPIFGMVWYFWLSLNYASLFGYILTCTIYMGYIRRYIQRNSYSTFATLLSSRISMFHIANLTSSGIPPKPWMSTNPEVQLSKLSEVLSAGEAPQDVGSLKKAPGLRFHSRYINIIYMIYDIIKSIDHL